MIAIAPNQESPCIQQKHQDVFLEMLPRIRSLAGRAFGWLESEMKDELIQEVTANAFCAFVGLVRRGKSEIAYATPLTNYAIRQVMAGRRVGTTLNVNDVTSPYAQAACRLVVGRLDRFDNDNGTWQSGCLPCRPTPPDCRNPGNGRDNERSSQEV